MDRKTEKHARFIPSKSLKKKKRVEFDIGPRYINYFREKYRENRDLSNELSFMIVY
jgi:hypothetical protein